MSTYLKTLGAHGLKVSGVESDAGKVRSLLSFLVRFLRGDGITWEETILGGRRKCRVDARSSFVLVSTSGAEM
jgi:hypothetical protein